MTNLFKMLDVIVQTKFKRILFVGIALSIVMTFFVTEKAEKEIRRSDYTYESFESFMSSDSEQRTPTNFFCLIDNLCQWIPIITEAQVLTPAYSPTYVETEDNPAWYIIKEIKNIQKRVVADNITFKEFEMFATKYNVTHLFLPVEFEYNQLFENYPLLYKDDRWVIKRFVKTQK